MKYVFKLFYTILIVFLLTTNVKALTVSENNLNISAGNTKNIELSTNTDANLTSVEFTLVFDSYDVPAYFSVNSMYTDTNPNGITHKIVFNEPTAGNIDLGTVVVRVVNNPTIVGSSVNIHSAKGTTEDGNIINLNSQTINIKIGEETVEKNKENTKDLLKEINSEIVNIKLKENVFEYEVSIDKDTSELDLSPVAIDDKYKVEVSNQKISELEDNTITITVSDDIDKSTYKINVKVKEENNSVEIDNSEYKEEKSYKGKWIFLIVCLSIILFFGVLINKKSK